ncbi:MAG: hypothetical protein ABI867_20690 [Kofleriaceae bacterium]
MRQQLAAVAMMAAMATGCGAAKSALGALGGGSKPTQTVVVNVPPPVVVQAAPAPSEPKAKRFSSVKAMAAGAMVGGVVGYALDGKRGAAIGAGAGAAGGVVAQELTE